VTNYALVNEELVRRGIMPYHPIGQSKSERIGKAAPMEDATFASWEAAVAAATHVPVKKGS
jgi:hypothetical protein